jgi:uncharacterized membrane protein
MSIWARFICYGVVGVAFEIVFTGTKELVRSGFKDWSLKGKSYIWMFPIYGLAAFLFEPLHDALRSQFWIVRGLIYTAGLFTVEFITGWLLRATIGKCPWDYTGKKYNFMGLIRWNYAPVWFVFCLALEKLHDLLLHVKML